MFTRTPLDGYIGTGMAIRDADFRDQAPNIAVPTVCVVGDQDGATPPDLVRGTADMIPGAKFELGERCRPYPLRRTAGRDYQDHSRCGSWPLAAIVTDHIKTDH
jgi:pimeloyl-ACP methyl ester carboxylesterase